MNQSFSCSCGIVCEPRYPFVTERREFADKKLDAVYRQYGICDEYGECDLTWDCVAQTVLALTGKLPVVVNVEYRHISKTEVVEISREACE